MFPIRFPDGLKQDPMCPSRLLQAILDAGLLPESASCLRKAHDYIEQSQVVQEAEAPLDKYYRHISKGAWPFSTRDHGWPISDCSSEGLKAALALARQVRRGRVGGVLGRRIVWLVGFWGRRIVGLEKRWRAGFGGGEELQ